MNVVAEALNRYRTEHGLSQRAMGRLVGMTQVNARLLEMGVSLPSIPTLQRIARLFQWTAYDVGEYVLAVDAKGRHKPGPVRKVYLDLPETIDEWQKSRKNSVSD